MTYFPSTMSLAEPSGVDRVDSSSFAYMAARNRRKVYSAVIKEFKKSNISQADLARRMGQRTDVICRWLSGPGNWTLDTVSSLLFGISGAELSYSVALPLKEAPRNLTVPEWAIRHLDVDSNKAARTTALVGTAPTSRSGYNINTLGVS